MTAASYPADRPHTPETVIAAARTVDDLIRHLNHATIRGHALADPADLCSVLAALSEAAMKLPQLLDQLAMVAGSYVDRAGLYDSHGVNPRVTATDVKTSLSVVAGRAYKLIDPLRAAHEAAARLGVQAPKGNQ